MVQHRLGWQFDKLPNRISSLSQLTILPTFADHFTEWELWEYIRKLLNIHLNSYGKVLYASGFLCVQFDHHSKYKNSTNMFRWLFDCCTPRSRFMCLRVYGMCIFMWIYKLLFRKKIQYIEKNYFIGFYCSTITQMHMYWWKQGFCVSYISNVIQMSLYLCANQLFVYRI